MLQTIIDLVINNSCNLEPPAIGVFFTKPHLDSSAGPLGGKHATAAFIESRPAAVWGSIQSTTCKKTAWKILEATHALWFYSGTTKIFEEMVNYDYTVWSLEVLEMQGMLGIPSASQLRAKRDLTNKKTCRFSAKQVQFWSSTCQGKISRRDS